MAQTKNLVWQTRKVSMQEREKRNGHQAAVLWFTGLPASGKTTLSFHLEEVLFKRGIQTYSLDGDNVRQRLNRDLSFSQEDRVENIRRIGELARLFMDQGNIVLSSFISPYQKDREQARSLIQEGRFIEIFVDCPLEQCEIRDPKGHYKKARSGEIQNFTGISAPYEIPMAPEIHLCTADNSVIDCVETIKNYLLEKKIHFAALTVLART